MVGLGRLAWLVVGAALLFVSIALPAHADRRVALVIGNSTYTAVPALTNPRNDATDIATALRDLGFEVMLRIDVNRAGIQPMMKEFARLRDGADTALVYYAGHGVQYSDSYYLVPVDAALEKASDLRYDMLPVDDIRREMADFPGVRIAIYDSCRNDPFKTGTATALSKPPRAAISDRPQTTAVSGSVEVFATAPLDVAEDGNSRNSPFTKALLKALRQPGLDIRQMFERVAGDVKTATRGLQTPQIDYQLTTPYVVNRSETDRSLWARIRFSNDPIDFRDFLSRFPDSQFSDDAQYRLGVLERTLRAMAEFKRKEEETRRATACTTDRATIDRLLAANAVEDLKSMRLKQSPCPETSANIDTALSDIDKRQKEAAAQAHEAACRQEVDAVDRLLAAHDKAGLTDLTTRSGCSENAAKISQALATLTAAEAAELCREEVGRIAQLQSDGKKADIAAIRAKPACTDSSQKADQALADIADREKAEMCRQEAGEIDALAQAGKKVELGLIKQKVKCADSPKKVDQALADIAQREKIELCRQEATQIDALGEANKKAELNQFRQKTQCAETPAKVDQALAGIAQREKVELCRQEGLQADALGKASKKTELNQLKQKTQCAETPAKVDQALADIAQREKVELCRQELTQVDALSQAGKKTDLTQIKQKTQCTDTPGKVDQALADIAQREKVELCRQELTQVDALGKASKKADLNQLKQKTQCAETPAKIDRVLADIAGAEAAAEKARRDAECRADTDGVKAMLDKNRKADLQALAQRPTTCADAHKAAEDALAEMTRRETEARIATCQEEAKTVDSLQQAKRKADLQALKAQHKCDETPGRVDDALALIDAQEKADLKAEAEQKRIILCKNEATRVETFATAGDKASLEALTQAPLCKETKPLATQALADLVRKQGQCSEEAAQIKTLSATNDLAGLQSLAANAKCRPATVDLATSAQKEVSGRLEAAAAAKRQAQCRDEATRAKQLGTANDRAGLQDLATNAQCTPETSDLVAGLLKGVDTRLEVAARREKQCHDEADRVRELGAANDRQGLRGLATTATCKPETVDLVTTTLASLTAADEQQCKAEDAEYAALDPSDLDGLKALSERLKCAAVSEKAKQRLAAIANKPSTDDAVCAKEQDALDTAKKLGEAGREQLTTLRDGLKCERLRPMVLASLGDLPTQPSQTPPANTTPPVSNSPDQIKQAATYLKRVGCYVGSTSTVRTERMQEALKTYYRIRHVETDDLAVNDQVLARLEKEGDERVCAPEPTTCRRGEHESNGRCVRDSRPQREPQREPSTPRRPSVADTPRPQPSNPPPVVHRPSVCIGC